MATMSTYVLRLQDIDKAKLALVGGKGANLGELTRIEGIQVPDGFCISTRAFAKILGESASSRGLLDQLSRLKLEDQAEIGELSAQIRGVLEGIAIPEDIREEIRRHLLERRDDNAWAIRSSATAEDLPTASFAGQQDTYLNVIGEAAILDRVSKCWASLFTKRAVIYRIQNGFDHRKVQLSVVVQKMVCPQAAGIMFTADPVTHNRKLVSIDASFGLGEALVSGRVNADNYMVSNGKIVDRKISTKKLAIYALKGGGTKEQAIELEHQNKPALPDEQVLLLERIGRKIEQHFGSPQDIEWCLADGGFYVVQSRPITTSFPIPEANDGENHVYVSVGHQQMMTDPMKPLGLSFFLHTTKAPMRTAGGRLFVDVTRQLASPVSRQAVVAALGKSDPLIKDALMNVLGRGDFIKLAPDAPQEPGPGQTTGVPSAGFQAQIENDPAIAVDLIKRSHASLEELKQTIQTKSGVELLDFIIKDIQELKRILFEPRSMSVITIGMDASSWINEKMSEWLGEKNAADTLSQSVPNNVTSEMGLALLDVADAIRPYPEVIAHLQQTKEDAFLDDLVELDGGKESRDAIFAYLDKYGMRCGGEIDITRTRWSEKPITLVPLILSNIRNSEPNAGARRFEQGRQEAAKKELELLARLKQLPGGEQKAEETRRVISLVRNFIGYREYPKYGKVSRYFVYKQALLKEADRLVQANVIREQADIFYLTLEELREVVRTNRLDDEIVSKRKDEHKSYAKLTPPRVLTSDGESVAGVYGREDLPAGAIAGLAVSSGVVEGRARVILNMEDAELEDGDILVTVFTDPGWTPLFVSIKGLVTEVGGLMTHGAVIAREYGLPAVVGVEDATKLIKDGQRIRVHGTEGYVELL
jgi:pyruvate,water dikinase